MTMIQVIMLSALALTALATYDQFQIYSPSCAVKRLPTPINYSLSNFGVIPYGETFFGQIHIPKEDSQLCSI